MKNIREFCRSSKIQMASSSCVFGSSKDISRHFSYCTLGMTLWPLFLSILSLRLTPSWSFAPSALLRVHHIRPSFQSSRYGRQKGIVRYEPSSDQPEISYSDSSGVWTALAATEKWIVQTLATSGGATGSSNPYTRKEVNYVCEIARESSMVVASLFRRVREARELGESYAEADKAHSKDRGPENRPSTFRQTQVIVIPWCIEATSYPFFDTLLQAVNRARRNAKDFFTDISLDSNINYPEPSMAKDKELTISINIACLHPKFGEKTPKQILEEMRKEEEEGEIDVNLKEYVQQRNRARQSPFPTFVLEVRATPQMTPTQVSPPSTPTSSMQESDSIQRSFPEKGGDSADIAKLQALFGLPAATKRPTVEKNTDEDDFYDQLSMAFGDREVFTEKPMTMSQNWISNHDPFFNMSTSTFTLSDSKHVDAAYEFVFNNIAMLITMGRSSTPMEGKQLGAIQLKFSSRSYLVMPHFLSSSATSFEKFAQEVAHIVECLGLRDILSVSVMHPEHVQSERRSPYPIFVLQWFHRE